MNKYKKMTQQNLFESTTEFTNAKKFISIFRVSLIRDKQVTFSDNALMNSVQAHALFKQIIETQGQPDREQFIVLLLNAKNHVIGLNIVATGSLTAATAVNFENMVFENNGCEMVSEKKRGYDC